MFKTDQTVCFRPRYSRLLLLLLLVITVPAFPARAQGPQDLPYSEDQLRQYSGLYNITSDESDEVIMQIRLFAENGRLYGQINENEPSRMMQQEMHLIRPQAATDWLITLSIEDDIAKSLSISSPIGFMNGTRVDSVETGPAPSIEGG